METTRDRLCKTYGALQVLDAVREQLGHDSLICRAFESAVIGNELKYLEMATELADVDRRIEAAREGESDRH